MSKCQVIDLKEYRKRRIVYDLPKERALFLALVNHTTNGAGPGDEYENRNSKQEGSKKQNGS